MSSNYHNFIRNGCCEKVEKRVLTPQSTVSETVLGDKNSRKQRILGVNSWPNTLLLSNINILQQFVERLEDDTFQISYISSQLLLLAEIFRQKWISLNFLVEIQHFLLVCFSRNFTSLQFRLDFFLERNITFQYLFGF